MSPNAGNVSDGLHSWDLPPKEAMRVQRQLRDQLHLEWESPPVELIAGVDVHFEDDLPLAAVCVLSFPQLDPIEAVRAKADHAYPYVPGLLAFREGPAVLEAWGRLRSDPDLVMFDAHGIAHPRGMGLASHLGLWLGRPSIGVAKSRLYGTHDEPDLEKGAWSPLFAEEEAGRRIGAVVRTRDGVKPVFVSPGHLIDLETAIDITLECCPRYKLPEPTRWAHRVADGAEFPA